VHFFPFSAFALFGGVEAELKVAASLSVYVGFGGGLLGQLAAELGTRLYPMGRVLEGPFFEAHGQGFFLPRTQLAMLGPGAELGWAFRSGRHLVMTIGLGLNLWWSLGNDSASAGLGGNNFGPPWAAFFLLPGLNIPLPQQVAVQPSVRLTVGPVF
jgi:hypothetical protein